MIQGSASVTLGLGKVLISGAGISGIGMLRFNELAKPQKPGVTLKGKQAKTKKNTQEVTIWFTDLRSIDTLLNMLNDVKKGAKKKKQKPITVKYQGKKKKR